MSAYTATNWTVTKLESDIAAPQTPNAIRPKKRATFKITLATGGQQASTGVPLPRAAMGFVKRPSYFLHNDMDAAYTTASARALKFVINATAEKVVLYRMTVSSGTATNVGGRAIRKLATTVTVDVAHSLFITAEGW